MYATFLSIENNLIKFHKNFKKIIDGHEMSKIFNKI